MYSYSSKKSTLRLRWSTITLWLIMKMKWEWWWKWHNSFVHSCTLQHGPHSFIHPHTPSCSSTVYCAVFVVVILHIFCSILRTLLGVYIYIIRENNLLSWITREWLMTMVVALLLLGIVKLIVMGWKTVSHSWLHSPTVLFIDVTFLEIKKKNFKLF